ncbi:MAG: class I SAM-dependent methyltransferase [Nocardioides sp.]
MSSCCDPGGYDDVFGERFARRSARRYRRRGLSPLASRLVSFIEARGLSGATVLEVGGGSGDVQVELLKRGAAHATNLELSRSYDDEARALIEESGLTDRVTRLVLDIATHPDEVEMADVVVLNRVVCCYPDYERLLGAAGSRAGRLLVFSHPADNPFMRLGLRIENLTRWLRRDSFRAFVHPPARMLDVLADAGLRPTYRWQGPGWVVVGLER